MALSNRLDAKTPASPPKARTTNASQVFRRYVSSASTWHLRLVRYFQAQAPSPRRCEELPWHLNKCYRWHLLKNTLVDLRTFEVGLPCRARQGLVEEPSSCQNPC